MNNLDDSSRFDGNSERFAEYEWSLSFGRLMPDDFARRLERLREASGLTWSGMARAVGVDYKQLRRWRKGVVPCGGSYHALVRFARRVPGGMEILFGEDFWMTH